MATTIRGSDNHAVKVDRIISRAFATMRANPVVVFGLSLIFGAIPATILGAIGRRYQFATPVTAPSAAIAGVALFAVGIAALLFYILAQAALVRATVAQADGHRASVGECAIAGLRASVPLIVLNILIGIACGIGFLFFLVPGIFLFVLWAVASPALVAEPIGILAAFSRSVELTRGARWKVFGVELIAIVFAWVISAALGLIVVAGSGVAGLTAMARAGEPLWYLLLSAIIRTLVIAIWSTIQASLYIELRDWKDGPSGEALVDVFA